MPNIEPNDFGLSDGHFVNLYKHHTTNTLHLHTKEASGYTLLGLFTVCVRDVLSKVHIDVVFFVDHQFQVYRRYSVDDAVNVVVNASSAPLPVIEYKPRVASNLMDQDPFHLSALFLQALYLRNDYKHQDFHRDGGELELIKYYYIKCTRPIDKTHDIFYMSYK